MMGMVCSRLIFGFCLLCLAEACQDEQISEKKDLDAIDSFSEEYGRLFIDTADRFEQLMNMVAQHKGFCDQSAERLVEFLHSNKLNDVTRFHSMKGQMWERDRKEVDLITGQTSSRIEQRMDRFKSSLPRYRRVLAYLKGRCPEVAEQIEDALWLFQNQSVAGISTVRQPSI